MSSSSPAAAVAPSDVSDKPPPRKFPPPCWTQEETLCLIEAYRERWYALRRGYLRTADWDAVAAAVTSRCPGVLPAKTSAQCRHKMEKLRQRHRAEKQRALSYPYPAGRYFSSWFFFENMEAMEKGTEVGALAVVKDEPNNINVNDNSNSNGLKMKSFLDDNIMKLKLKAKTSDMDSGLDGFGVKGFRSNSRYSNSNSMMMMDDVGEEEEDFVNVRRISNNNNNKAMNAGRISLPMGVNAMRSNVKNTGRMVVDYSGGFGGGDYNVSGSGNSSEQFYGNNNNTGNMGSRSRGGVSSNGGVKRGRDELEDIASSIKMLTDGYVKMERAKMEMAREMEETRMEMELKRNEMLLESQKQIVDAFVKGLVGMKMANKKAKPGVEAQLPETELGS